MKVSTVWGILPVFIFRTDKIPGTGAANGPFVRLRSTASERVLKHELVHVKQFYMWAAMLFVPLLSFTQAVEAYGSWGLAAMFAYAAAFVWFWASETGEFMKETAAYGASARHAIDNGMPEGDATKLYATVYDSSKLYKERRSFDEIKDRIRKRARDRRIF